MISLICAGSELTAPETRTFSMSNTEDENTASAPRPSSTMTTRAMTHQNLRRPRAWLTAIRRAFIRGSTRGPVGPGSSGERASCTV